MEYPNIVRDTLNPHADMLRELKLKCNCYLLRNV